MKPTEIYKPEKGEVLTRNHVIATNPADGVVQQQGLFVKEWGIIPGTDIAGTVVEVILSLLLYLTSTRLAKL